MLRIGTCLALALAYLSGGVHAQGVKPDPLLAVDQNRATVIERIVSEWGDALAQSGAGIDPAKLREMLASLRADRLLGASLAGSVAGLRDVLANAVATQGAASPAVRTLTASGAARALAGVTPAALGDAGQDLVYTPVTPCRLFDTRASQGGLGTPTLGVPRTYSAVAPVPSQGGVGGCAAPAGTAVALIQIGTLTPSGNGLLQGGPQGATSFPNALILYQAGDQYGTAVAMPLNPANGQFTLIEQFSTADLYGDLLGYFRAPAGGHITGSCPAGKAVRSVNGDGSVVCESTGASATYQPALRPWVLDLAPLGPNYCCYIGGFTDGVNGYLVPFGLNNVAGNSGRLLRVNLDTFTTAATASVDVAAVDPNAIGFIGGFTDGRYGYLVPYTNMSGKHGRVARVDLQNFTTAGVTILNLQSVDAALSGFYGGFTDGRYGYLYSFYNGTGPSGRVVRIDLHNFLATPTAVTVLNLAAVDAELVGHTGGFTDGRYGYVFGAGYSPVNGKVARFDLSNFTAGGVTVLDLGAINPAWKGFVGGFQDGRYGYLVPYNNGAAHGNFVRIDLANFTPSGVAVIDLSTVDPALVSFSGGFTDGRYAWLAPFVGSKAARVDLANFAASGVRAVDFGALDASLTGFSGGFSNGRFGVMVPSYRLAVSGFYQKALRIQLWEGPGTQ